MNKKGSYMKIDTSDSVLLLFIKTDFKVCILIISVCMCSGDDLWKLVLFFHHVGPREQLAGLTRSAFYPLNHLDSQPLHLHFKS